MSFGRAGTITAACAAALALAACGGDGDGDKKASTAAGAEGCSDTAKPAPKRVKVKKSRTPLKASLTATVQTNCGSFEIELDAKRAPKTGGSFAYLVRKGYYDGTVVHRIVPGFVVQGGDPQGTGMGGPGYSVDEKPPADLSYTKGVVAMAKTAAEPPGRSGSQFFVVTAADAGLPPEYALLGKVVKGQEVVDEIGKLGTEDGTPATTVVIEKITLSE
jgi:cyclophilin family peptidyl-prolyl cis-trans isomerase